MEEFISSTEHTGLNKTEIRFCVNVSEKLLLRRNEIVFILKQLILLKCGQDLNSVLGTQYLAWTGVQEYLQRVPGMRPLKFGNATNSTAIWSILNMTSSHSWITTVRYT